MELVLIDGKRISIICLSSTVAEGTHEDTLN